jgi:hypothetical protein
MPTGGKMRLGCLLQKKTGLGPESSFLGDLDLSVGESVSPSVPPSLPACLKVNLPLTA